MTIASNKIACVVVYNFFFNLFNATIEKTNFLPKMSKEESPNKEKIVSFIQKKNQKKNDFSSLENFSENFFWFFEYFSEIFSSLFSFVVRSISLSNKKLVNSSYVFVLLESVVSKKTLFPFLVPFSIVKFFISKKIFFFYTFFFFFFSKETS